MTDAIAWLDSQMTREQRIRSYWLEAWLVGRIIKRRRLAVAVRNRGCYARRRRLR